MEKPSEAVKEESEQPDSSDPKGVPESLLVSIVFQAVVDLVKY